MTDITDLEQRIISALDRIKTGVDGMGAAAPAASSGEANDLRRALDEEKTANAQLEERVKLLKDRQDGTINGLQSKTTEQQNRLSSLEAELAKVRATNDQLRDINAQLRQANETGVGEPHLINKAMLAELEALRAVRASDRGELDAMIAEIEPLAGEA
jgi:predicted  nucleic acid-binding Zn-ribbon protein